LPVFSDMAERCEYCGIVIYGVKERAHA
jgi:hypothetical protein